MRAKSSTRRKDCMSDAAAFLNSYRESLRAEVSRGVWPPELTQVYEPESCLKHSGAKEVYLVTDKRTGARVVLRASDLDAGERADVEYAILSRLNFPGVPKTYGTLIKGGRSYLAREFFEGEPLDKVVARGVLHPSQIERIARQICAILGYLHAQNPPVIHRDIKPQNIIMRPDGSIGLTDFGIARTFKEDSDSDTQYMGTLLYAPPEQYGYAQSSPQTDIYALGIVLIYLATGSPDRRDLARRISHAPLRALIEKCIAFDPKSRFQNAGQVVRRLDSFKTRRLRIGGMIAGGCLVLALLGVGIWQAAPLILNAFNSAGSESGVASGTDSDISNSDDQTQSPDATGSFLSELANREYPSTGTPHVGSTNWLYDYNNDGNLHSNINNGGFAVAGDYGSEIYVASDDSIYVLDEEGTVLKELYSGSVGGSLNIYNGELYFTGYSGTINAINLDNSTVRVVNESVRAQSLYFDDGRLYLTNMLDNLNLYTMRTDGSSLTLVSSATSAYYTNIVDGIRYYSDDTDGGRIYAQELATGRTELVYDSPAIWLSVCNGRIYFDDDVPGYLASIKLDGSGDGEIRRNGYYRLSATITDIDALHLRPSVVVADWESPATEDYGSITVGP